MADVYRLVKSPKSFNCSCGKQVPAKTYRIEYQKVHTHFNIYCLAHFNIYCLACGEKVLLSRKAWHRQRWVLVNKVLRGLRGKTKDRIVQRLS